VQLQQGVPQVVSEDAPDTDNNYFYNYDYNEEDDHTGYMMTIT
jgi:hypothetical protein